MSEPKCPECSGHHFSVKAIRCGDVWAYVVFCKDCGHIVGTTVES